MTDFTTMVRVGRLRALAALNGRALTARPSPISRSPLIGRRPVPTDRANRAGGAIHRMLSTSVVQLLGGSHEMRACQAAE